jgi:hypothetical protein
VISPEIPPNEELEKATIEGLLKLGLTQKAIGVKLGLSRSSINRRFIKYNLLTYNKDKETNPIQIPKKREIRRDPEIHPVAMDPPKAPTNGTDFSLNDIESYISLCLKDPMLPFNSALIQTAIKLKETQDKLKNESQSEEVISNSCRKLKTQDLVNLVMESESEPTESSESQDENSLLESYPSTNLDTASNSIMTSSPGKSNSKE